MADPIEGKLIWQGEGKNRKRLLSWKNKAGEMTLPNRFPESQLAAELRDNQESAIDVHLELENGQPRRIRPVGQAWQEAAPIVQAAPRDQRDNRPRQHNNRARREEMPNVELRREFHNPYNFIPAPPRKKREDFAGLAEEQRKLAEQLCDAEPIGHDRYVANLYSGKLRVRMKVETPVLLPDTTRMHYTNSGNIKEHKSYPVRVDENGKPIINPTAIKGMLRSAYEAITNSRLSVFKDHNERLAFRGEAKTPIAARIEMHNGNLHIRKFRTATILVRYRKHWKGEKDKLEKGDMTKTPPVLGRAMKYSGSNDLPQHGQAVWVKISDRISTKGKTIGKKVDEIKPRAIGSTAPTGFIEGWACVTGANAKDKVYERVFVEPLSNDFPLLTDDHKKMWTELISNYQKMHEEDLKKRKKKHQQPTDYLGNNPGDTAWSRQIYDEAYTKLDDGTLCYLVEEGGRIKSIIPVMISRRLYEKSPLELLSGESNLRPAEKFDQFSPADRVFGWVKQKGQGAYRGQLRIGVVSCLGIKATDEEGSVTYNQETVENFGRDNSPNEWLPLQTLGQPKPQQGRFYVAKNDNGEAQDKGLSNEQSGYRAGKGLRGRKVYPHYANLPIDYWFEETLKKQDAKVEFQNDSEDKTQQAVLETKPRIFREYLRPKNLNEKTGQVEQHRDSQNRSIQGWVKPQTEFEFDIHFINLSKVELGALIWLLTMNGENENRYFHRFGGGKPLGFGSVKLCLESSDIRRGDNWREFYQSLDDREAGRLNEPKVLQLGSDFKTLIESTYPTVFNSFLRACKGFSTNLPVHYPRTEEVPNPKGESFKWFVENSSKDGFKLALPDLGKQNQIEIALPRKPKS